MTVADRIDYESVQAISFTARARDRADGGVLSLSTQHDFVVNVVNINDHQPVFSESYYEVEIRENVTSQQTVVSVLATDLDLYPYGDIRYVWVVITCNRLNMCCVKNLG